MHGINLPLLAFAFESTFKTLIKNQVGSNAKNKK